MFNNTPFHSLNFRIAAVILIICFICITASSLIIANNDLSSSKMSLIKEASSIAEIISNNIGAAVAFRDIEHANEIVSGLSEQDSINQACIYDSNGALFTGYITDRKCEIFSGHLLQQENLIIKDITNNGLLFGKAYIYYDEARLQAIKQNLVWKIAINLLFLLVLLVLPITFVINKLIKKPVVELIDTTKLIGPSENFDNSNLIVAKENIERIQQQLLQATSLLKFSQGHSQKLIKNFNVTLDIIGHDINKNRNIASTNKKYSDEYDLDAASSKELLKIANNEMSKFGRHFDTLKEINDQIHDYLSENPEMIDIHTLVSKQFQKQFGSYALDKFVLQNNNEIPMAELYVYKSALTSFFNYTLMLFDYLCDYPNRGIIHFELVKTGDTRHQLGRFTLRTINPISLDITPPTLSSQNPLDITDDFEDKQLIYNHSSDDQFSYLLEAMTLFANLNCISIHKSVSISLLKNGIEVNFIITDSRVTDAKN